MCQLNLLEFVRLVALGKLYYMYRMKIVLYFIKQPQELQEKQMNKCPVLNKWLCSPPFKHTLGLAYRLLRWVHRSLQATLEFLCPRSPESTPIRKIYFLGLQQIIGRLPQSSARRKKKKVSDKGTFVRNSHFQAFVMPAMTGKTPFSTREISPRWLRRVQTSPSFQKQESLSLLTRRQLAPLQLEVKRMSPSFRSRAKPTAFGKCVGGLLLLRVPTCLCVCEGGTPGGRDGWK